MDLREAVELYRNPRIVLDEGEEMSRMALAHRTLLSAAEAVLALQPASDAATKGPWYKRSFPDGSHCFLEAPKEDPNHAYNIDILGDDDTQYSTREADIDLIAAAVNLVRKLLEAE